MMNRRHIRIVAAILGLSMLAAACGDDDDGDGASEEPADTTASTEAPDDGDDGDAGALAGMKGTTPLVDLSDDFKDRLLGMDPDLSDFNYAAESYDSTILIALATAQAVSDGLELATAINGNTREGEQCENGKA